MKETEDFYDDILDDELELEEDSNEFDEDDNDEDEFDEPLEVQTAVMTKNEMLALLSLKLGNSGGGIIVRVDPRQSVPVAKAYEDPEAATKWFYRSLATSKRNGWTVVYVGEPLLG